MELKDIMFRGKAQTKLCDSGWKRIPAISSMTMKIGEYNQLLKEIGISRRLPTQFEFKENPNKALNRYMIYQLKRLERFRDEGKSSKYWFVAWTLMKKSTAFRVSAINRIFPGWYKTMPIKYLFKISDKVERIFKHNLRVLEYKRVYIPKSNGKMRPLGVPTHAWRVALHMHAAFMSHFLIGKISENQHAYRTHKGCKTAWESILRKVNYYRYIYEIDLKNCFNEINGAWVTKLLVEKGVPLAYARYLEKINASIPKLTEKDEVDETTFRNRKKMNEIISSSKRVGKATSTKFGRKGGGSGFVKWESHRGLPQGSPLSPILTVLVLDEFTKQAEDSVFYADDGLFFGNKPFMIEDDPAKGILISEEKSGWVKAGKWLKPLKFLGLIWQRDSLQGATRHGSHLQISGEMSKIFRFLQIFRPAYANLEGVFNKTSLGGNILSKLYNNSWETKFYESMLTLTGVRNSWLQLRGKRDNYVTTSSEACYALSKILENRHTVSKPANKKIVPKFVFWRRARGN